MELLPVRLLEGAGPEGPHTAGGERGPALHRSEVGRVPHRGRHRGAAKTERGARGAPSRAVRMGARAHDLSLKRAHPMPIRKQGGVDVVELFAVGA